MTLFALFHCVAAIIEDLINVGLDWQYCIISLFLCYLKYDLLQHMMWFKENKTLVTDTIYDLVCPFVLDWFSTCG